MFGIAWSIGKWNHNTGCVLSAAVLSGDHTIWGGTKLVSESSNCILCGRSYGMLWNSGRCCNWRRCVIQLKPATSQRKRLKKTSQVTRLSATIWIFTSMWNTCPMHWIGLNVSWKSFAISVMMRHAISVWFCDFLRFSALFHRTRLRFSHKKFFISWKPILPYFTLTVPFDLW